MSGRLDPFVIPLFPTFREEAPFNGPRSPWWIFCLHPTFALLRAAFLHPFFTLSDFASSFIHFRSYLSC